MVQPHDASHWDKPSLISVERFRELSSYSEILDCEYLTICKRVRTYTNLIQNTWGTAIGKITRTIGWDVQRAASIIVEIYSVAHPKRSETPLFAVAQQHDLHYDETRDIYYTSYDTDALRLRPSPIENR